MNKQELIEKLKNKEIYSNSFGVGKIKDIIIDGENIRVKIEFKEKTSKFALKFIINSENYKINDEIKNNMNELLNLIFKPSKIPLTNSDISNESSTYKTKKTIQKNQKWIIMIFFITVLIPHI